MAALIEACAACGAKNEAKGRFCPQCGAALSITCTHCGQQNARTGDDCSSCGQPLSTEPAAADPPPQPVDGRPLERRQLTIMFTDLVNSTGLADSMDPEDFRTLIEAHRTIAVAPITRYDGVVARYLGDGMLVFFGYPEAHEDDPERAVRAGLEVVQATLSMNSRWVGEGKGRIAVRVGIHTGIVVVGDVLKADVQEQMAVFGNAPSIAARLQALAQPNSVLLSADTKALLPSSIRLDTRGNATLKGLARPMEIFTATEVREGEGDRRPAGRILPFVNREQELATIGRHWSKARRGEGSSVMIEGEPGIGKSRLIRTVEERIVTQPSRWLITRTSPYAANTDFFAFSELFRRLLQQDGKATSEEGPTFDLLQNTLQAQGLGDINTAIGLASLLTIDIPEKTTPTPLQPERTRELTLAAITTWLTHESQKQPLVLVIEDLHWADASTLEAIDRLKTNLTTHPLLLLTTTRSATRTSLTGVRGGSPGTTDGTSETPTAVHQAGSPTATQASPASAASSASTVVYLERLRDDAAADLLGHVLQGVALPKESVGTLLQRANGVPLYLEELPKPVLEVKEEGEATPIVLPATLRDSLMAQLDRMGEAKTVAQTAAVLGHRFERPLLEYVWEGTARSLDAGLNALTESELLAYEAEAQQPTYGFRHALLAEIAYDSLLRHDRRRMHEKTADILAKHFRPLADLRPEILAQHHEGAGNYREAFDYWLRAGKAAAQRSANKEAIEQLNNAEASLRKSGHLRAQERNDRRLALLMARAPIQVALQGWSAEDVEKTYNRALEISEATNDNIDERFAALGGLYNVYLLRGDLAKARAINDQEYVLAKNLGLKNVLPTWHSGSGYCDFLAGRFADAEHHMDEVLLHYAPSQQKRHMHTYGTHPAVIANAAKAWSQWFLGKFSEAKSSSKAALGLAEDVGHPFSMCYALCFSASIAQCNDEAPAALDYSNRAFDLSAKYSFPYWLAWSRVVKGWAVSKLDDPDAGLSMLNVGLSEYDGTGAAQMRGYMLCLAADGYRMAERFEEAAMVIDKALGTIKQTRITFYQAEAYRQLGMLQLSMGEHSRRSLKTSLRAMRVARQQRSLPLELQAMQTMLMMTDQSGLRFSIMKRKKYLSKKLSIVNRAT